jgi:ankyrin repeat protein
MNAHAASAATREEQALQTLLRAIAARDQRTTSRLLAQAPSRSADTLHPAVRALLTNGADALRKNNGGSTPLHFAIQNTGRGGTGSAASREQQTEIIRLLLSHGVRPSDRNSAGRSVKDCVKAGWIQALLRQP